MALSKTLAGSFLKMFLSLDSPPDGLVLEAPFNSVYDAAKSHPFAKVCIYLTASTLYQLHLRQRKL